MDCSTRFGPAEALARTLLMSRGVRLLVTTLPLALLAGCLEGGTGEPITAGPDSPAFCEVGLVAATTPPDPFHAVSDGETAPVVMGSQGAYMLVAQIRTNAFGPEVDIVTLTASVAPPGGEPYGRFRLRRHLRRGDDGLAYLDDVYLIVEGASLAPNLSWDGTEARIAFSLESLDGAVIATELQVVLDRQG